MPSVSIVIPAYNEENRISDTLKNIEAFIAVEKLEYEIIVVDDGSTDRTPLVASGFGGLNLRVISNEKNMGKGFSICRGMKEASGDIILFTDADMSTPITFLPEFLKYHKEGCDVVIASRDIRGSNVRVPQNFLREFGGKFFNLLVRSVTGLPIHDTQCGFKSFTRKAAAEIFPRQTIHDFGFDVEILYIAKKHGLRIMETPVEWRNAPGTKVKFLKDSIKMAAELFKIKFNDISGKYM
jgi:dolichyl-phosphate beta-glucosyltransferase